MLQRAYLSRCCLNPDYSFHKYNFITSARRVHHISNSLRWHSTSIDQTTPLHSQSPHGEGIITLYPGQGPDPDLDVIAVHGLGSNLANTWTHAVTHKNWLRDFLPISLPKARILAYNHDSKWQSSASQQSLSDYSESLLSATKLIRRSKQERARPIIYIGHSFGGTIIKKALCLASGRIHDPDPYYRSIFSATKGVVFLGTPHGGSAYASAGRWTAKLQTLLGSSTELFKWIEPESLLLSELNDTFLRSFTSREIYCFFEAKPPTNSLGIPQPLVVDKASAIILGRPHGVMNLDHMQMSRYASMDDQNYQQICNVISQMTLASPGSGREGDRGFREQENFSPLQHALMSSPDLKWTGGTTFERGLADTSLAERVDSGTLQEQNDLLDALRSSAPSIYESDIPTRHDGTCEWIFDNDLYKMWDDPNNNVQKFLLIAAPPGWGKSVLAKHLLDIHTRQTVAGINDLVLGFFCKNTEDRNNASAIIRSFLHGLLSTHRNLFRHVLPHFTRASSLSEIPFKLLWAMLTTVLADPHLENVRLIIDGLDELQRDSQLELLGAIEEGLRPDVSNRLNAKVLITSRPNPVPLEVGKRLGLLQLSLQDVSTDISVYVRSEVQKLADGRGYPLDLAERIRATLETDAEGMFLWVGLVLQELNGDEQPDTRVAINKILDDIPRGLEDFYARNLGNIAEKSRKDAKFIYQTLLASPIPLSQDELGTFFATWPKDCTTKESLSLVLPLNVGRYAKTACGSLIKVTDAGISFVHQSVRDYFESGKTSEISKTFELDVQLAHSTMLKVCLKYLLLQDLRPILASKLALDGAVYSSLDEYPFLNYALTWWCYHARSLDEFDEELCKLLGDFLGHNSPSLEAWLKLEYSRSFEAVVQPKTIVLENNILGALYLQNLGKIARRIPLHGPDAPSDIKLKDPLIDKVLDVNGLDGLSISPLSMAAGYDRTDDVIHLMKAGANPMTKTYDNSIPLHYACSAKVTQLLVQAGSDINAKDDKGSSPLHVAVIYRRIEVADMLLELGALPDEPDSTGHTPLHWAILNDYQSIFKSLLAKGANIHAVNNSGTSSMAFAARSNSVEMVDLVRAHGVSLEGLDVTACTPLTYAAQSATQTFAYLLELGVNIEHADSGKSTLLYHVADFGSEACLQLLLDKGANVNAVNELGHTALYAAAKSGRLAAVKMLIDKAADTLHVCEHGWTILLNAVVSKNVEMVDYLLKNGFDVNERDKESSTVLHMAAAVSSLEMVTLLLEAKADVNADNVHGISPLAYALHNAQNLTAISLLEAGADPNNYATGTSFLHICARDANLTCAEELIKRGADANFKTPDGEWSVLHLAADDGNLNLVELLVEKGKADLNCRNSRGFTPLHYAAWSGHGPVVNYLIEHGADVDAKSEPELCTPLHLAALSESSDVIEALISRGANHKFPDAEQNTFTSIIAPDILQQLEKRLPALKSSSAEELVELSDEASSQQETNLPPPTADPVPTDHKISRSIDRKLLTRYSDEPYEGDYNQDIQTVLDKAIGEAALILDSDLELREKVFMEEIATAENLFQADSEVMKFIEAAGHLYKAFKVYPQYANLIKIYRGTVPKVILAMFFEMLSRDQSVESKFAMHTPFYIIWTNPAACG